jgi:hypothetical protein
VFLEKLAVDEATLGADHSCVKQIIQIEFIAISNE